MLLDADNPNPSPRSSTDKVKHRDLHCFLLTHWYVLFTPSWGYPPSLTFMLLDADNPNPSPRSSAHQSLKQPRHILTVQHEMTMRNVTYELSLSAYYLNQININYHYVDKYPILCCLHCESKVKEHSFQNFLCFKKLLSPSAKIETQGGIDPSSPVARRCGLTVLRHDLVGGTDTDSLINSSNGDTPLAPDNWLILFSLLTVLAISNDISTGSGSADDKLDKSGNGSQERGFLYKVTDFLGISTLQPLPVPDSDGETTTPNIPQETPFLTPPSPNTVCTPPSPPRNSVPSEESDFEPQKQREKISQAIINSTPLTSRNILHLPLPDLVDDMMQEISQHITPSPEVPIPPLCEEEVTKSDSASTSNGSSEVSFNPDPPGSRKSAKKRNKTLHTKFLKIEKTDVPPIITKTGMYSVPLSRGETRELLFENQFLTKAEADTLYAYIDDNVPLCEEEALYRGRKKTQPRLMAWYGPCDYPFSGCTLKPCEIDDLKLMEQNLGRVNDYAIRHNLIDPKRPFNSILVNKYRDGKDSVGWHPDNESIFVDGYPIIGLNTGGTRDLEIRGIKGRTKITSVRCTHGSLYGMMDDFQSVLEHRVPKTTSYSRPRISLTYRRVDETKLNPKTTVKDEEINEDDDEEKEDDMPKKMTSNNVNVKVQAVTKRPVVEVSEQGTKRKLPDSAPSHPNDDNSTNVALGTLQESIIDLASRVTNQSAIIESIMTSSTDAAIKEQFLAVNKQITLLMTNMNEGFKQTHALLEILGQQVNQEKVRPFSWAPAPPQFTTAPALASLNPRIPFKAPVTPIPVNVQIHQAPIDKNPFAILADLPPQDESPSTQPSLYSNISEPEKSGFTEHRSSGQKNDNSSKRPFRSKVPPTTNDRRGRSRQEVPPKKKRVLLLHDSLFKHFDQEKFGSTFQVTRKNIGSYKNLANREELRKVVTVPSVDAYVIALGTNDVRDCYSDTTQDHVMSVIATLREKASADVKIMVHIPPPRQSKGNRNDRLNDFANDLKDYVTGLKDRRVSFIDNMRLRKGDHNDDVYEDDVHISQKGSAILNAAVKTCLRRVFGMTVLNSNTNLNRN